jgi:TolA-binding protein
MMKKTNVLGMIFLAASVAFTGCALKTRSEVNPSEQSFISRRKQQEAQKAEGSKTSSLKDAQTSAADPEETIRTLNGRIEVLENNVIQLQKENAKLAEPSAESAKITALQDALSKMELQIQKLEGSGAPAEVDPKHKSSDDNLKPSIPAGELANTKKTSYDVAEDLFTKKDWKKAILSYQKFAEEFPKSKLVPDAKYKTGVSFQELGLKDEALAFYEEVSVQYPQTQAGKKAKIRIASLSKAKAAPKSKKK